MEKSKTKLLGTATTIGELKALIDKYPDNTSFGFRNQPLQSLHEVDFGDNICVVFDELLEKGDCTYCNGHGWHEPSGDLCDKCIFGDSTKNYIQVTCPECAGGGHICGSCLGEGFITVRQENKATIYLSNLSDIK